MFAKSKEMRMDFQIINLKQMIEGFLMLREGLNKTKKKLDLSTFGWVGGSGWGQNPQKKPCL